jgi:hypothetical protein
LSFSPSSSSSSPSSSSSTSNAFQTQNRVDYEVRRLPRTNTDNIASESSRTPLTAALSSTYVLRSSGSRDGLGAIPVATVMMPSGSIIPSPP